jgi:hypothetical protein
MSRAAILSRKAVSSATILIHKAELRNGKERQVGRFLWRCGWHGERAIVHNTQLCVVEETNSMERCSMFDYVECEVSKVLRVAERKRITHVRVQISEKLEDTIRNVYKCFRNGLS